MGANTDTHASTSNYFDRVRFQLYAGGTEVLDEDYARADGV